MRSRVLGSPILRRIGLRKSRASIWLLLPLGVFTLGISFMLEAIPTQMGSKPFYMFMTRYGIPGFVLLAMLYETYVQIVKKPCVVIDSEGIHDGFRGFGTLSWDDIGRLQFLSNFGIYQIHVYLKGRKNPARLGPVSISEKQRETLKQEIPVQALWM